MTRRIVVVAILALLAGAAAQASIMYRITLDTSSLPGDPAGPFLVNFQLTDGDGSGNGNNTALLTNFDLGGGIPGGPVLSGGATGSIGSSVTITDTSFFNDILQGFTPGSILRFDLELTTNLEAGPTPDSFVFALTNEVFSFFDVFVHIDIDSSDPAVQAFPSEPSSPIGIAAPLVQRLPIAPVPEPSSWLLTAGAFGYWAFKKIVRP